MKKFDIKKFSGRFEDLPLLAVFATGVKAQKKTDLPLFVKCGNTTAIKYTPSKQFSKERFKKTARVSIQNLDGLFITNAMATLHEVHWANVVIPAEAKRTEVSPAEAPVVVGNPSALAEGAPDAPAVAQLATAVKVAEKKKATKKATKKAIKKAPAKKATKAVAPKQAAADSKATFPFPADNKVTAK